MRVTDTIPANIPQPTHSDAELSLAEFANYIYQLSAVPSVEEIKQRMATLELRRRDYETYRIFTGRRYARNLIVRSEFAEVLLLCWHAGQRTPIHDHGGSVGVVMVVEGCLTETMYEQYNTHRWNPGGITGAEVRDIHQLLNLQAEGRDLVTLHCYAPPLSVLNTFSPVNSRRRKWREGYFTGGGGI
jgi:cysteine dioxygenase